MGTSETDRIPAPPYFDANARLVAAAQDVKPADRDVLAAFMTIQDINIVLSDPHMNFLRDIEKEFIIDLQVDVKKSINPLSKYKGSLRAGIREAMNHMNNASQRLYEAQDAAENGKRKAMSAAMIKCLACINIALGQLQALETEAQKVRAQVPQQAIPAQKNAPTPTRPASTFQRVSKDEQPSS